MRTRGPLRNPVSQSVRYSYEIQIYLFICKNRLLSFIRTSAQGRGKCIKIIYLQQIADGGNVFSSFMEIFR